MSELVYVERYKLPAGILAILVNGVFFAFIIFGVSWRVAPQQPMVVDIWESLPEMDIAPLLVVSPLAVPPKEISEPTKVPASTRPAPVKIVEPTLPSKAEIELAEKKKKKEKEKEEEKEAQRKKKAEQEAMKALKLQEAAEEAAKALKLQEAAEEAAKALKLQEAEQMEKTEQARAQSEKIAARNSIVNNYKARIMAKIKSKIKWPEEGHITAVYEVTLLPDGSVFESKLIKSSGNSAYDRQTESAIKSAEPLPLPPDQALFSQFRTIQLKFSPTE